MKKLTTENQEKARIITRKQAIKKAGLTALTTVSVMFLSSKQSSAAS